MQRPTFRHYSECEIHKHSQPKWDIPIKFLLSGLRGPKGRGGREDKCQRTWTRKRRPSKLRDIKGDEDTCYITNPVLPKISNHLKMSIFFSKESHLRIKLLLKASLHAPHFIVNRKYNLKVILNVPSFIMLCKDFLISIWIYVYHISTALCVYIMDSSLVFLWDSWM